MADPEAVRREAVYGAVDRGALIVAARVIDELRERLAEAEALLDAVPVSSVTWRPRVGWFDRLDAYRAKFYATKETP